jgi:hypothetical protein
MSSPPPEKKSKRDRALEGWYTARRQQAMPRVYPAWVDMGALSFENSVRFDKVRRMYDIRDVLLVAYGSEAAVKDISQRMFPNFGLGDDAHERIKWSDCLCNSGRGRVVVDAASCVAVLRASKAVRHRVPAAVDMAANWFAEQSKSSELPALLLATYSAHAVLNKNRS